MINNRMTDDDDINLESENCFKHVVDYYTNRWSHVFVCFADFSKAFDKVNYRYWKLFNQLIELGLSTWIVALLVFWYSHQQVCVNWHGKMSSSFSIGNGTKQGGLLSPCLFNCYVRKLIFNIIASFKCWMQHWGFLCKYTCICWWHGFARTLLESSSASAVNIRGLYLWYWPGV